VVSSSSTTTSSSDGADAEAAASQTGDSSTSGVQTAAATSGDAESDEAVAASQLDCENPFAGVSIRFRTNFWTKTNFCIHSASYLEFRSGGPAPDEIPPIDDPQFESIAAASEWLQPQSPVISIEINGDARAYPLAVMSWHEIANDVVGEQPVVVTYCPLCNSGLVFNRVVDGNVVRFGNSGTLRNSDLVMWDDLTQSWWQQLSGEAVVGDMTGYMLEFIPSQMVSFGAFVEQYPDGIVLSRNTGATRSYGNTPYEDYENRSRPFLFEGDIDNRLPPTERVLAGMIGGQPMAYPFSALAEVGVINDIVNDRNVVAIWQPGATAALDRRSIDESRDVGMAALYNRELDGRVLTFFIDGDGNVRDEQTNTIWNVFGTAIEGELAGSQLRQINGAPHFWFAWAAFQPETFIYGL